MMRIRVNVYDEVGKSFVMEEVLEDSGERI